MRERANPKSICLDGQFTITPKMLEDMKIKTVDDSWLQEAANTIGKAQAEWLDGLMRKNLPSDIFDCARSEKPAKRMKASKFIAAAGFQQKCHPEGLTELWKGDKLLGSFKVEMKDFKIQCLVKEVKE